VDFLGRLRLKCDGTRAETIYHLSAKRTSPFKPAGASVQSTTGSRGVRFSGSNAGYTKFRGSVKGTGYPLHSPVSPSFPVPCVTVCHHVSTGLYNFIFFFNGATARFGHWSLQIVRLQIYLSSASLLHPLRFSSNKESLLMSSHLSRVIPTRFLPLNFPFSSMYIR